jgi:carbonic anhydrase
LNVIEQVLHVTETSIIRNAWQRQQRVSIHGWIYGIENGLLQDLSLCISQPGEVEQKYHAAVDGLVKSAG